MSEMTYACNDASEMKSVGDEGAVVRCLGI